MGEVLGQADGLLVGLELETSMQWIQRGGAGNLHRASSAMSNCCDMPVEVLHKLGLNGVLLGGVQGAPCKLPLVEQGVLELDVEQDGHIWRKCQRHLLECLHVT